MASINFEFPLTVYYEDTDAEGVVYHSIYLNFMERARSEWLRSLGIFLPAVAEKENGLFVVKSLQVDYQRPARLLDHLVVRSSIQDCSKTRIKFKQSIYKDTQLLVSGLVEVVCIHSQTFKPKVLPLSVLQEFQNVR